MGSRKTLPVERYVCNRSLFDMKERTFHLVRDRLGIKPLYWGLMDDTIIFGSELKSFPPSKFIETNDRRITSAHGITMCQHPTIIYNDIYKLELHTHRNKKTRPNHNSILGLS